ncbi:MAG TPA: glycosyltransferase [Candidatus Krumholzibacteria bacterium]|nr:glycosyltransferase [Candidatus Krumholzibacteria bacterium]HPD72013.1 glycosyltransferase [Candidatus Krumholzibacteria bacterium]HRY41054.1 glycosyltransferase [Candidatus Krumholzibacteria bacterium]
MTAAPVDLLYCIDYLPAGGGTENQLAGLIDGLDRTRLRPHLCTLKRTLPLRDLADCPHLGLDVPVINSPRALTEARRLYRYLRDHDVRIVHSFFQDSTILAMPVAALAKVPVRVVSFRDLGFWRTPKTEFLMRRAYRFATGFLANSQAVKDVVVERDRIPPAAVAVIPNGIDTAGYRFDDGGPLDPPTVVYVGNLNREVKRPDLFVEAAGLVATRWPRVRWVCVGDGDRRAPLARRAAELGLAESMQFLGRRHDIPDLLAGAAIGVNCSDSEGLSNAVLEYMLAGAVVVATAVGGNREVVRDRETGLLVAPGDAGALAGAIAELLADPELAARCRRQARADVLSRFSWERCRRDHEAYYSQRLGRRMP